MFNMYIHDVHLTEVIILFNIGIPPDRIAAKE